MHVGKHFHLDEFQKSAKAKSLGIDNTMPLWCIAPLVALVENVLDPVRDAFGPVVISSGYRCPKLNKAVGGVKNSQHIYTKDYAAADFEVPGVDNLVIYEWVKTNCKFDQLLLEFYSGGNIGWAHCSYSLVKNRQTSGKIGGIE